jgi:hypothetical protein
LAQFPATGPDPPRCPGCGSLTGGSRSSSLASPSRVRVLRSLAHGPTTRSPVALRDHLTDTWDLRVRVVNLGPQQLDRFPRVVVGTNSARREIQAGGCGLGLLCSGYKSRARRLPGTRAQGANAVGQGHPPSAVGNSCGGNWGPCAILSHRREMVR